MVTQTVQIRVNARNIWQQTQVVVQSGDHLSVSVPNPGLPNLNHPKPWPWGPNCDPDGNRTDGIAPTTWANAIAPNIVQFSLIGRIGENGTPFLIGSSFEPSSVNTKPP